MVGTTLLLSKLQCVPNLFAICDYFEKSMFEFRGVLLDWFPAFITLYLCYADKLLKGDKFKILLYVILTV